MQQHTQEQIEEIKKNHPEAWQVKRAAGLDEQLVASVILAQVEHDKDNPPEAEARARLERANAIITAHLQRAIEAAKGAEAMAAEIRLLFPEMEIQIVEVGVSDEAAAAREAGWLQALREMGDKVTVAEQQRDCLKIDLAQMTSQRDAAARGLAEATEAFGTEKRALETALKAAQEALKGIAAATKLKDAKDAAEAALKPAPAPTPAGDDAPKADAAA